MRKIIIIHGWSDHCDSFEPLGQAVQQIVGRDVKNIWLGNYVSLDDDIEMGDLVRGMQLAWNDAELPDQWGQTRLKRPVKSICYLLNI